jgi:hypothetical protein
MNTAGKLRTRTSAVPWCAVSLPSNLCNRRRLPGGIVIQDASDPTTQYRGRPTSVPAGEVEVNSALGVLGQKSALCWRALVPRQ